MRSTSYIYVYIRNYGVFFQNFGLSGYAENEIYASWFQKSPKDGPSYDNATKMFYIDRLCTRGQIVRHFSSYAQRNVKCCAI